jgi:2-polyprenyl-3-methyl-5-hydroxy-6-metoxy-1,4-benzoquinol methylase
LTGSPDTLRTRADDACRRLLRHAGVALMDRSYGERYARLYREHWWWRAREEFLVRLLDKEVGPGGADHVLDFGCGDGLFLERLARYGEPRGIETDERLLSPGGPWRARIATAPLSTDLSEHGRYGLIVALDVLEHIPDPAPVMAELARRLRPGGLFVATVPAFQQLWTAHDVLNEHQRRYTTDEAAALVRESGLAVSDARYFFVWLAVLKWGVRLKEHLFPSAPRAPEVPWAPLNAFLLGAARLEQMLIRGTRPPFGSSALVIARRI